LLLIKIELLEGEGFMKNNQSAFQNIYAHVRSGSDLCERERKGTDSARCDQEAE